MEFVLALIFGAIVFLGALAVIIFGDGRRGPVRDEGTLSTTANGQPRMFTLGDPLYFLLGPGRPDWDA